MEFETHPNPFLLVCLQEADSHLVNHVKDSSIIPVFGFYDARHLD